MGYPSFEEYTDALRLPPSAIFQDPLLAAGSVRRSAAGLPFARSGNFALTYEVTANGARYAVRCFHKEADSLDRRYDAIARKLRSVASRYFVDFEFQPAGIRTESGQYPIVRMAWAEGCSLAEFISQHRDEPETLLQLRDTLRDLARHLEGNDIGHGDIQPGNLIVRSATDLKLIDYDGMYVPELEPWGSTELGQRNFQHPGRSWLHFDERLDRFSFALLDVLLEALAIQPALWELTGSDEAGIILRASDFADPSSSTAFGVLAELDGLAVRARHLAALCRAPFERVPSLDDFLAGRRIPAVEALALSSRAGAPPSYIPAYPVVAASNFARCCAHIGDRVELIGRVRRVVFETPPHGAPGALRVEFGGSREDLVRLVIWPDVARTRVAGLDTGQWLSAIGLMNPILTETNGDESYKSVSLAITEPSQLRLLSEAEAARRLAFDAVPDLASHDISVTIGTDPAMPDVLTRPEPSSAPIAKTRPIPAPAAAAAPAEPGPGERAPSECVPQTPAPTVGTPASASPVPPAQVVHLPVSAPPPTPAATPAPGAASPAPVAPPPGVHAPAPAPTEPPPSPNAVPAAAAQPPTPSAATAPRRGRPQIDWSGRLRAARASSLTAVSAARGSLRRSIPDRAVLRRSLPDLRGLRGSLPDFTALRRSLASLARSRPGTPHARPDPLVPDGWKVRVRLPDIASLGIENALPRLRAAFAGLLVRGAVAERLRGVHPAWWVAAALLLVVIVQSWIIARTPETATPVAGDTRGAAADSTAAHGYDPARVPPRPTAGVRETGPAPRLRTPASAASAPAKGTPTAASADRVAGGHPLLRARLLAFEDLRSAPLPIATIAGPINVETRRGPPRVSTVTVNGVRLDETRAEINVLAYRSVYSDREVIVGFSDCTSATAACERKEPFWLLLRRASPPIFKRSPNVRANQSAGTVTAAPSGVHVDLGLWDGVRRTATLTSLDGLYVTRVAEPPTPLSGADCRTVAAALETCAASRVCGSYQGIIGSLPPARISALKRIFHETSGLNAAMFRSFCVRSCELGLTPTSTLVRREVCSGAVPGQWSEVSLDGS